MPNDYSFDLVSQIDLQAMDDAVNNAMKEINNRFDLKGTGAKIELNRTEKTVTIHVNSEFQLKQVKSVLLEKMIKRNVSVKALSIKKTETNLDGSVRETNNIISGIEKEMAKSIVKDIKALNLKVQASIQDDQIRVSGRNKDDLQTVISYIKSKDYPIPIQFINYR